MSKIVVYEKHGVPWAVFNTVKEAEEAIKAYVKHKEYYGWKESDFATIHVAEGTLVGPSEE